MVCDEVVLGFVCRFTNTESIDYYTTKREGWFKTLLGKSGSDC